MDYMHCQVVLQADNGTVSVRHSRFPADFTPDEAWEKLASEAASDLPDPAKLLAVILDEKHEHPAALLRSAAGAKFVRPEHMP